MTSSRKCSATTRPCGQAWRGFAVSLAEDDDFRGTMERTKGTQVMASDMLAYVNGLPDLALKVKNDFVAAYRWG